MHNPLAIANGFLAIARKNGDDSVSNLKLQKLVYFAQGWHLALTGKPLIRGNVEAWRYGPVIPEIYEAFKKYGNEPIEKEAAVQIRDAQDTLIPSIPELSDNDGFAKSLLERIWEIYGDYTALELSTLSHREGTPWRTLYDQNKKKLPDHCAIPNDLIRKHFAALVKDVA